MPRLSEGALVVDIVRLPGTDLDESMRYNTRMEKVLLAAFPDEVEHVWSRCGTAEVATDPMGPEVTDLFITLKPRDAVDEGRARRTSWCELIEQGVRATCRASSCRITQPIEQRINEMISGVAGRRGGQALRRRLRRR